MAGDQFTGWFLDEAERAELLRQFEPAYRDIVADHVTLRGPAEARGQAPAVAAAEIVGVADDGSGVQALVVKIDGTTRRPDGGTYHITWSLDRARGRKPVESNAVIAQRGWQQLPHPRRVTLHTERRR